MVRLWLTGSCCFSQLAREYPDHPLVADYRKKADLFDELAAKFTVPALATALA